jgi:hypothetical protein
MVTLRLAQEQPAGVDYAAPRGTARAAVADPTIDGSGA